MDPQHPDVPAQPDLDPADPVGLVDPIDPGAAGAEEEDRAGSLTALAGLSSSRLSLEDLLTRVATFAVQAISGADGAGLTMLEADRADTVVKSAPFVTVIDDIQYGIGEGPWPSKTTGNFTLVMAFGHQQPRPPRSTNMGLRAKTGDPVTLAVNDLRSACRPLLVRRLDEPVNCAAGFDYWFPGNSPVVRTSSGRVDLARVTDVHPGRQTPTSSWPLVRARQCV